MRRGHRIGAARPSGAVRASACGRVKFGFTSLLRRVGAVHSHLPAIGLASRPQQEPFRLGQSAALTFAPREIAESCCRVSRNRLRAPRRSAAARRQQPRPSDGSPLRTRPVGPQRRLAAALPRRWFASAREPQRQVPVRTSWMCSTTATFTHMHRAWAQSQAAAGLDRATTKPSAPATVRATTGHDRWRRFRHSPCLRTHDWRRRHTSAANRATPTDWANTLARFFAVPVQLQEFVMHWIRIDEEDQSHLGKARTSSIMGVGAIAGEGGGGSTEQVPPRARPPDAGAIPALHARKARTCRCWSNGFEALSATSSSGKWNCVCATTARRPARLEDKEKLGWSTWPWRGGRCRPRRQAAVGRNPCGLRSRHGLRARAVRRH